MTLLPRRRPEQVQAAAGDPIPKDVLATAASIVHEVQTDGDVAARRFGKRFDELGDGPMWFAPDALRAAHEALPAADRRLLHDVAGRIRKFAEAQRDSLREITLPVPGGRAHQRVAPVERAGCYAPGGLATLPSSLLMTAVTARAAGVAHVFAASPRPGPIVLAAAHEAGCDGLLALGGAQAIAALVFGDGANRAGVDVVVGPGNRYVTAAKQLVAGRVGVDLPAGPSELCVLADETADPARIAADLLAQAEHDPAARPWLVTCDAGLQDRVDTELEQQLEQLATGSVARQALACGGSVRCGDLDAAIALCDRLAPEHLQLALAPDREAEVAPRLGHYGALFLGRDGAEVLGDYGAGPNHVLPTAGAARFTGGLSVFAFLRIRTWLELDGDASELLRDAARLADHEGLPGHAAAARMRLAPRGRA